MKPFARNRHQVFGRTLRVRSYSGSGVALSLALLGLMQLATCARVSTEGGSAAGSGGRTTLGSGGSSGSIGTGTGGGLGSSGGAHVVDAGPSKDDGGPSVDANCGFQDFVLDRRPAIVVLLQDRSTSMRGTLKDASGASVTRWGLVVNAVKPILEQTQASLAWGLKLFPDNAICGVQPGVNIAPDLNNANAINAQLNSIQVTQNSADNLGLWDGTPVAPALRQAAAYLLSLPSDKQKYIVLATDGQPTCAGGNSLTGGGNPDSDDRPSGPAAIAEVLAMGIKVPVIGIAFSKTWDPTNLKDNEVTLNDMAKAGGMPRATDPAYYGATSAAELADAFAQITGAVISCTFDLKGRTPPSPDDVAVKINGVKVTRDKTTHTDGWDYDTNMANVLLYGKACDQLKASGSTNNVQIIFGCPGVVIP